jgi:hypothetical protein
MIPTKRSDSYGKKSETGRNEGARLTRIVPSQFGCEKGILVGANSATEQCGEWKEDEWQELLARLSTGCRV